MTSIGVIGCGVVGTALINQFSQFAKVYAYDIEPTRSSHSLGYVVENCEFVFICVPTPSDNKGSIDLTYVKTALSSIAYAIVNFKNLIGKSLNPIVIIKSTITPGSTDAWRNNFTFSIAHVPEFLTERTSLMDFAYPSRIVIGASETVGKEIEMLYAGCFHSPHIIRMRPIEAELVKYMSNCFFATKITFMNELSEIARGMGIDTSGWNNIVEGFAASGRVARSHLNVPGPDGTKGYGGACFPKDIAALISQAENIGVDPILLKAVQEKNGIIRGERDNEKAKESGVT